MIFWPTAGPAARRHCGTWTRRAARIGAGVTTRGLPCRSAPPPPCRKAPGALRKQHEGATARPSPSPTPGFNTRRQRASLPSRWRWARWKQADDLFWRYGCVAHEGRRSDAGAVLARQRFKGGKEQMFKDVLRGLDRHHPPGESLMANRMFYALGALAYHLMKAVQLLCLPDACQRWRVATLLRQLVRLPAVLVRHARRLVARVAVAVSWLGGWQAWEARWWTGTGAPAGAASG